MIRGEPPAIATDPPVTASARKSLATGAAGDSRAPSERAIDGIRSSRGGGQSFLSAAVVPVGMVHAFVMVKADSVGAEAVLDAVLDVAGVTEAHVVAGDFDIIAEVEAEAVYDVLGAVATDVRSIDGVVDTKTYVALE